MCNPFKWWGMEPLFFNVCSGVLTGIELQMAALGLNQHYMPISLIPPCTSSDGSCTLMNMASGATQTNVCSHLGHHF